MQVYKNSKRRIKKYIILIVIFIIICIAVYSAYSKIDIYTHNGEEIKNVERISRTEEKVIENDSISELLEENINSVVGISKIKDKGNTIFLNDGSHKSTVFPTLRLLSYPRIPITVENISLVETSLFLEKAIWSSIG